MLYEEEVDFRGLGPRWIQAVYTPTFGADGIVDGWVAVVLDLTERRRMEEALRASENRFHRFMDASPVPAYIKDEEGRYLYVNQLMERKFTRSPLGKSDLDLFPLDTAEKIRRNDRMVLDTTMSSRFDEVIEERDGRHHYLSFKFPLADSEGRKLIAGVSLDLTEQRRAEQAVREGEERFRTLADYAPVLIWLNDLEGCLFVNRAYLDFTGRGVEDLRGMKWADCVHPEDAPGYLESYQHASARRESFDAQFRFRRVDGEYRWLKSVGVPRFTGDGVFLGYVGCSLDITEIKEYEESLKDLDRRKDEFVAILAHELRNPLAPIQSAVEILKLKGPAIPELMWSRDVIDRQARLMARLLDDLLDVNRITRGKLELRKARVELRAVVESAIETSRPLIEMSGHELAIQLPAEPVELFVDPVRLEQVLSNLLNNAARYTSRGGHILLSAEKREDGIAIQVKDDGVGIAPELLPRVFDLFAQAPAPGGSREGLGIGLSLVRSLVTMHGGSIEARSNHPGAGTEFVIRLPLDPCPTAISPASSEGAETGKPAAKCRIVVVDDNRDAAESLTMILRALGNDVRVAYDGLEALRAASDFRPDVVLLDIGMPGLNGYDVARSIRQEPWGREMVLLAVSGWGQEEDKRRARESGFDHHLTKPIDAAEIGRVLAQVKATAST